MSNVDPDIENKPQAFSTNYMQAMIADLFYKCWTVIHSCNNKLGKKIAEMSKYGVVKVNWTFAWHRFGLFG